MSHDATFKCCLSVIGQKPMAQKDGEVHTAHTFLGVTGGCPGYSLQPKEGADAFGAALRDRFTATMIAQVRMLYSDSPAEQFLTYLPNCIGVAEDNSHLVFAAEYCLGGRRTACARSLLQLQGKLRTPMGVDDGDLRALVYHGEHRADPGWDAVPAACEMTPVAWADYLKRPYGSHEEYVAQLKRVSEKYTAEMSRRSKKTKGRTLLDILKTRASPRHFFYLVNTNIFRSLADEMDVKAGTQHNEALHRVIKLWLECVYKQHADHLDALRELFGLYKMLGNTYHNIGLDATVNLRERRAVCCLSGIIARGEFEPVADPAAAQTPASSSRDGVYRPRVLVDGCVKAAQKEQAQRRAVAHTRHSAWTSLQVNCA